MASALQDKNVNTKGDDSSKKIEVGGARWAVKGGDGDIDDITKLLGQMSINAQKGDEPNREAHVAKKVLDSETATLKDSEGKTVELVKVVEEELDESDDEADAMAGDFAAMLLSAKAVKVTQGKNNRKDAPNPLKVANRDAASYFDSEVRGTDVWLSLSVGLRQRLQRTLAKAIVVETKKEARGILDAMFLLAGEGNDARLRDMLPWVTGEF